MRHQRDGSRLPLGQLMLWVLATCLHLGHEKWRLSSGENPEAAFLWYASIHAVVYCPLQAAGSAGLVLWLWRRLRGGSPFPAEPGHWFLVIQGAANGVAVIWDLLDLLIGPNELLEHLPSWVHFIELIFFEGLCLALILWAAAQPWSTGFWRTAFLAMALNPLCLVLQSALANFVSRNPWFMNELGWSIGARLVYALPAVLAVLAGAADWRAGRTHDFLHWIGIVVVIALAMIEWPSWIVWLLLFR
jgi:hypothetical protein